MSPPDPAPESLPAFRDLASQIARTRTDFGRVYDEIRSGVPDTRSFKVVALGTTSDSIAFERALRQAQQEGWFTPLAERLIRDDFFPNSSSAVTSLHAVLSAALGFSDASVAEKGSLRARARLCRVEVEIGGQVDAVTGTGFLVGPSTILTSFHVVSALVDEATGLPKPRSDRQLSVRFDHATDRTESRVYRVPGSWLVSSSPPHPSEVSPRKDGGVELQPPSARTTLDGYLDYAVIVVAGSPGAERGYYDLGEAVDPAVGAAIHLFQHPMGVQQRRASGAFGGFRAPPSRERIDHSANALPGSSGGLLLLDDDFALVGLHQGAYGGPNVVNTGISAKSILAHIRAARADLLDGQYAQAYRLADDSRPILGRASCQDWIRRARNPLVRVKPAPIGKGISFTVDIMRACLSQSEHLIHRFSASDFDSDAMRTAEMLLSRLGVDAAELPTVAEANSTRGVWIRQLATAFASRTAETHRGHRVWLVIDDLEKNERAIPDGSVRDFLSELYSQASSFTNLRIVLLGLRDFPSGFPTGWADDEDISPPQKRDVASYVRFRLTDNGSDYSAAEVDRLSALIMLTGGSDITSLSDYVADKVDRVLKDAR
ncbi:hypothetical protein SRABI26_00385 [Arthrobacter sp. Bi26]|uniref:trypsin-like serine peptidase n=1 Tax=Arthrobacter sp. Bi26 TaxID=2822350 RepID=UPI001E01F8CE|nr:trypsin-like peptidase domain-containing protein [Arthrobacter sp. Bi26]CAH0137310.1 hypothetical protein SRABI26_00385 [Arthrobacter sp. Bi26]